MSYCPTLVVRGLADCVEKESRDPRGIGWDGPIEEQKDSTTPAGIGIVLTPSSPYPTSSYSTLQPSRHTLNHLRTHLMM